MGAMLGIWAAFAMSLTPLSPPRTSRDCMVEPLRLQVADLFLTGKVADAIIRGHCAVAPAAMPLVQPLSVGYLDIGSIWIGRHRVGYGVELVVVSEESLHGPLGGRRWPPPQRLDELMFVPKLRLPEEWARMVDAASYPTLFVGATAIGTLVLIDILRAR